MPSRSEGRGGAEREPDRAKPKYLFKVPRSGFLMNFREATDP